MSYQYHVTRECSERTRAAYHGLLDACASDTAIHEAMPHGYRPSQDAAPYVDVGTMQHSARARPLRVSDVEHNGAFLGNDTLNYLFRAHHDAMHILTGCSFELEGEMDIAAETIDRLGLVGDQAAVLTAEVVGQAAYYKWVGSFPLTTDGLQPIFHVTDERVKHVDRDSYAGHPWGEYEREQISESLTGIQGDCLGRLGTLVHS